MLMIDMPSLKKKFVDTRFKTPLLRFTEKEKDNISEQMFQKPRY
jgi:hypothetical protein